MNNKLQIYAFAITSLCCLLLGVVIGQNFGKQTESSQLQASLIPTSLSTTQLPSASSLATSENLAKAKDVATSAASNLPATTSLQNLKIPTNISSSSLPSTTAITQAATNAASGVKIPSVDSSTLANAQSAASSAAAQLGSSTPDLKSLGVPNTGSTTTLPSNLNTQAISRVATSQASSIPAIPGVDMSKLTAEQQATLSKRLATAKETTCATVGDCPKPSDQVGNLAGVQQIISNYSGGIGNLGSLGSLGSLAGGLNANSLINSAKSAATSAALGAAKSAVGSKLGF